MENTIFEAAKFLEWFEENMTKLDISLESKSDLSNVLYHYASFIDKNKPTDKQKRKKEEIISSIKTRIGDEYRKHQTLDWQEIAARKIYGTYFDGQNNLLITAVDGE